MKIKQTWRITDLIYIISMSELLKINLIFNPPCALCSQIPGTGVTFMGQETAITVCKTYHSLVMRVLPKNILGTTKTAQRNHLLPTWNDGDDKNYQNYHLNVMDQKLVWYMSTRSQKEPWRFLHIHLSTFFTSYPRTSGNTERCWEVGEDGHVDFSSVVFSHCYDRCNQQSQTLCRSRIAFPSPRLGNCE